MNEHYRLTGSDKKTKDDELVKQLKEWVDEMYADGRTTSLSTGEMEEKIAALKAQGYR